MFTMFNNVFKCLKILQFQRVEFCSAKEFLIAFTFSLKNSKLLSYNRNVFFLAIFTFLVFLNHLKILFQDICLR